MNNTSLETPASNKPLTTKIRVGELFELADFAAEQLTLLKDQPDIAPDLLKNPKVSEIEAPVPEGLRAEPALHAEYLLHYLRCKAFRKVWAGLDEAIRKNQEEIVSNFKTARRDTRTNRPNPQPPQTTWQDTYKSVLSEALDYVAKQPGYEGYPFLKLPVQTASLKSYFHAEGSRSQGFCERIQSQFSSENEFMQVLDQTVFPN